MVGILDESTFNNVFSSQFYIIRVSALISDNPNVKSRMFKIIGDSDPFALYRRCLKFANMFLFAPTSLSSFLNILHLISTWTSCSYPHLLLCFLFPPYPLLDQTLRYMLFAISVHLFSSQRIVTFVF